MSYTYMGHSPEYWANIKHVMDKHAIKNGTELAARLKKPVVSEVKRDPMEGRVEVRDRKNPDRLLGTLDRPALGSPTSDHLRMACMGKLSSSCYRGQYDPIIDATRTVDFLRSTRDWTVVLTTTATLDDLMRIRDFRLPGESAEAAHQRHYMMD